MRTSYLVVSLGHELSKSKIVEDIGGKLFCSCHMDVNSGELCRHIQRVLGGCFKKQQFNDHWLRATDVDMCDRFCLDSISPASSRENVDVSVTVDDSLQTVGEICGENDIPHVTQLTQDCNTLGEDERSPDDIIQSTSTSIHSHLKKRIKTPIFQ